jgi:hypothetical protein
MDINELVNLLLSTGNGDMPVVVQDANGRDLPLTDAYHWIREDKFVIAVETAKKD